MLRATPIVRRVVTPMAVVGAMFVSTAILDACVRAPAGAPAGASVAVTIRRTEQVSGTRALLIGISPVSDDVAWVSGAQGTWGRTTDGGTTWTVGRVPGADSLQFRDVHGVDSRSAYLLSIGNGPQSRIYATADGGATWTLQFRNTDARAFYDCFDFWDPSHGIVIGDAIGTELAVLKTSDGGARWERVSASALPTAAAGEGSFAASGTCLETGPRGRAWIVMNTPTRSRLLRTTDYGRRWALETLPITTHEGSGAQSVIFRDARHGMVLGGGYAARPGDTLVAVTDDGGATWAARSAPPFKVGTWGGSFVPGSRVPTVVAAGPNGSAYSRDGATSWVVIDSANYWAVAFGSPRTGWAVGAQGRITRLSGW